MPVKRSYYYHYNLKETTNIIIYPFTIRVEKIQTEHGRPSLQVIVPTNFIVLYIFTLIFIGRSYV